MADYIVKDTELTSVANAIRTAGGTNSLLNFPNGFVSAVNNISGGGSSDFSTAEVTLTISTLGLTLDMANIVEQEGEEFSVFNAQESGVYKVILYKGSAIAHSSYITATSGSIASMGGNLYLITGDCTITISSNK